MYYQLIQNKESIFFRVDGDRGKKVGLGHIYRTLKIYRSLKSIFKKRFNYIFLMKNFKLGRDIIHNLTGERIITINKSINKKIFKETDIVIIDTLGAENFFLKILNNIGLKNIISFDQIELKNFNSGTIINGIFFAKKKLISKKRNLNIFQGPKYIILNNFFSKKIKKTFPKKEIKILISSGGADKKNFLLKMVKILEYYKNRHFKLFIAAGKGVSKKNPIFSLKKTKNLEIYYNVKNMKKLFDKVDLAVVSGGTTMFESVSSGKVTFVCQTYPHQNYATKYFEKKGVIFNIGPINNIRKKLIYRHLEKPRLLEKNYYEKFLKRTNLIDGFGLERVNKIILKKIKNA